MARYDATDNGASSDAVANVGMLYEPFQNVKVIGAYALETKRAGGGSKANTLNVDVFFGL